jgi:hypothetical protein
MKLLMSYRKWSVCSAVLCVAILGCGGAPKGPKRYAVSGTVRLDGKNAVAGQLSFAPDSSKGTQGPGALVDVKDGKFSIPEANGPVKGSYLIDGTIFDQPATSSAPRTPVGRLKQVAIEIPPPSGGLDLTAEKVTP